MRRTYRYDEHTDATNIKIRRTYRCDEHTDTTNIQMRRTYRYDERYIRQILVSVSELCMHINFVTYRAIDCRRMCAKKIKACAVHVSGMHTHSHGPYE